MLRYFPIEGRLILSDDTTAPPRVIFDTNDAMLCVKPDHFFAGSQVVPARTATSQGVDGVQSMVDVETEYYIATIDIPGVKVVRGMIRTTWASNPEPADNLWRQASGTHLDILDGVSQTMKPQSDTGGYNRVATLGGYTFYVNDLNHLVLKERLVIRCRDRGSPPQAFNRSRRQCTVSFRLLVGFFLQSDFTARPGVSLRAGYAHDLFYLDGSDANFLNRTVSLGYEFPGRRMLLLAYGVRPKTSSGAQANSIGIGGTSGVTHRGGVAGGSGNQCSIRLADKVISGSGDVAIGLNWPSTQRYRMFHLLALGNHSNAVPVLTSATVNGGSAASVTINVAPNQYAIVSSVIRAGANHPVCSWTNAVPLGPCLTSRTQFLASASVAVVRGGNGPVTVTANWSQSGNIAILGAVYS